MANASWARALREYYRSAAVRARIAEYCGGRPDRPSSFSCWRLGGYGGLRGLGEPDGGPTPCPNADLERLFEEGADVCRSLADLRGTLLQLDDVQFNSFDTTETYADAIGHASVNRKVENCSSQSVLLRTSGFADFAGTKVANGKGSLVCVLGKYNIDYQLFVRDTRDVTMTGARCGGGGGGGGDITANTTIKALKALHTAGGFETVANGLIIKGEVVMNDESGNYFKTMVIQDATGGIEVKIDAYDLFLSYPIGSLVGIRCQNLILSDYKGLIQLAGSTSNTTGTTKALGLTADQVAANVVAAGPATPIASAKPRLLNALTLDDVSTFVRLDDVQFIQADAGKTYADAVGKLSVNLLLEDCSSQQITLRTSGYATFAGTASPSGKGSIVGVLAIFNGGYQLAIRDAAAVTMNDARCGNPNPTGPLTSMNEGFDAATDNADIALNGWKNIATAGTRNWIAKSFTGDRYAQATAYLSNLADMQSWLITPALDLTAQRTMDFKTAIAFFKHDGLTVWVSNNFNGTDPTAATWSQITCDLAGASQANYDWVPSGPISLPIYATGVGHVAFKYAGNTSTNTTTFRLDNVKMQ